MFKFKTSIKCSCGREFTNISEVGFGLAFVIHYTKQLFYNAYAGLHFIKHRHKKVGNHEQFVN